MTHPGLDDDGLIRLQKLLAQSGVASRRRCEELMLAGVGGRGRRGGHPARHQGRPAHRGDPGRRQAAAADLAARLPRAEQAARRGLHDVRPGGSAHPVRRGRRPPRAALPRRPARHRHLRADHPHQRRRLRPAARAPVVRSGQDLRRRGDRRGHQGHAAPAHGRRHPRRRPGHRLADPDRPARHRQDDRRAGHPRGPQQDRPSPPRARRPPRHPAHPHPHRPGEARPAQVRRAPRPHPRRAGHAAGHAPSSEPR